MYKYNHIYSYIYIIYNACVTLWIPLWWHVRSPLCKVCQEESSWFGIDFSRVWRLATIWWNVIQRKRFYQFGFRDQSANFKGTTVSPFWNKDLQGLMIEWCTSFVAPRGLRLIGRMMGWLISLHHLQRTKLELQKCHWTAIWNTWMNQYGQDGEKHVTCLRLFLKCFWAVWASF